ncbi:hypothetical protein HGRIS_014319 [Hohenbuehelia grisea]|uniref:T4 RNA ligase 1-like N-terminal domain-containing protein n=1 Tax=Hohenbuehelia grisea TaxID=104357 RepID=A0ABR3JV69_9AGAR
MATTSRQAQSQANRNDELIPEFSEYSFNPLTALVIPPALLKFAARNVARETVRPLALIKTTTHPVLPLEIHNYTNIAVRRHPTNPLVQAARSLVTERGTGNVVARSFSKFFNYYEKGTYKPTGSEWRVVAEEKVDGSIIGMFWYAGEWRFVSKAQFSGPHVDMAQEILNELYPGATAGLDREKTYVLEVVHPRSPQAIKYATKKLVLLSIIGKDGSEPGPDFDWSRHPFPRPRQISVDDPTHVDLSQLQRMNLSNEEGFVVKFYRTPSDRRPARVKVKFDAYLDLIKSHHSLSPRGFVDMYMRTRSGIHSIDWDGIVSPRLRDAKAEEVQSLQAVADDFKGEAWLATAEGLLDSIFNFYAEQEMEWHRVMRLLQDEGFTDIGSDEKSVKDAFAARLMKQDGREPIASWLRGALFAWYSGSGIDRAVGSFLRAVKVPVEFQARDI